jgi:hypothetical protein
VAAAIPTPALGECVTEVVAPAEWNSALFMAGRRGGKTMYARIRLTGAEIAAGAKHKPGAFVEACRQEYAAAAEGIRAELARIEAVDARGVHGMVEHHGLIVPKHTPREVENNRWMAGLGYQPRWDDSEKAKLFGQPYHDNRDYGREFTWQGVNRDHRDYKDKL